MPGRSSPSTVTAMIWSLTASTLPDSETAQNLVQHGFRELAGEGVLLADVIAAQESNRPVCAGDQRCLCAVGEPRLRAWNLPPESPGAGESGIPAEGSQCQHRAQARGRQGEVPVQPVSTRVPFGRRRFVRRRRATHRCNDANAGERLTVAAVTAGRLARESRTVERGIY